MKEKLNIFHKVNKKGHYSNLYRSLYVF